MRRLMMRPKPMKMRGAQALLGPQSVLVEKNGALNNILCQTP